MDNDYDIAIIETKWGNPIKIAFERQEFNQPIEYDKFVDYVNKLQQWTNKDFVIIL